MSRIRSIKPDYWSSEQVMALSRDARLLFVGIWNFADDDGRIKLNPTSIKAQVLPGDDVSRESVTAWISELILGELLECYENCGVMYGYVTGWKKHQRIDKPQSSKYPSPLDIGSVRRTFKEYSTNVLGTFATEGIGMDPIRRDRKDPDSLLPGASAPALSTKAEPSLGEEIAALESRYAPELSAEARAACALSRKNGKMADPVWLRTLRSLAAFPAENVDRAMRIFVERYADGSKSEAYLIGIARNELRPAGGSGHAKRGVMAPAPAEAFKGSRQTEAEFDAEMSAIFGAAYEAGGSV